MSRVSSSINRRTAQRAVTSPRVAANRFKRIQRAPMRSDEHPTDQWGPTASIADRAVAPMCQTAAKEDIATEIPCVPAPRVGAR